MTRTSFATALVALALTACQQPDDANIAIDEVNNSASSGDIESLPPSEQGGAAVELNSGTDTSDAAGQGSAIPAQYRGRWGMVAADCTSTRGDTKGLITIADRTVGFYESTATLKRQRPAIATSFSGEFGFTGEGQTWDKVMTFTRTGDTLDRADDDRSFTYQRC